MNRRHLLTIAAFALGLVLIDQALGVALRALGAKVYSGPGVGRLNQVLAARDRDILVFGSSRAYRHVDPDVLEAELGLTAYNAGAAGQGLPYSRMLEALLLARKTRARIFVLQVEPQNLLVPWEERTSIFAPLLGESPVVDAMLLEASWSAPLKLRSWAYRYNSLLEPMIRHVGPADEGDNGYLGHVGMLDPNRRLRRNPSVPPEEQWAATRAEMGDLMRAFIRDARAAGIFTFVVIGPRFREGRPLLDWEQTGYTVLERIAREEGAGFAPLDERAHPELRARELFYDFSHLNRDGARLFTKLLATELARQTPTALVAPHRP